MIPAINIEKWNKTTPKNNCCINLSSFLCCPFGFESTMVPEVFLDFFLLLIFHRMRKLRERRERKNRFFFLAASRLVFTASRKEEKSRKTCGTRVHVTRKRQNVCVRFSFVNFCFPEMKCLYNFRFVTFLQMPRTRKHVSYDSFGLNKVNKYILLDVLLCIPEYFYELCRILASP